MPTIEAPPVARLVALTPESEYALGGVREISIVHFPFKIGRERRFPRSAKALPFRDTERRGSQAAARLNDVFLKDHISGRSLQVSGEHLTIDRVDDRFVVVDRKSSCGTGVAGHRIGGDRKGGHGQISDGDEIVVGTSKSLFRFRFEVTAE